MANVGSNREEMYGPDHDKWREPLECPHCKADLRDHKAGPPFKREIGQYSLERDMTVGYQCPDCGKWWSR